MSQPMVTARSSWWRRPAAMDNLVFYLCVSPWILGFIVFTAGPMLASIGISMTDWDLISPPEFIGLRNFIKLFTNDKIFVKSLLVTMYYTFGSVPLGLVVGLLIALLMNAKVRAITVFRTIYYLPSVVSGVAVALLWQ